MAALTVNSLMNRFSRTNQTITESVEDSYYTPTETTVRVGTQHPLYEALQAGIITEKVIRERRNSNY